MSPSAINCRRRVGATPYDNGADIIKAINATYKCLGSPVELIHIFGHSLSRSVPGTHPDKKKNNGLYADSFPLVHRSLGGRRVSEIPTTHLSNNVAFVLHGCNLANIEASEDNFARSLYRHLARSRSNPKVYGHYDGGCASRNKSWRVYSNRYPTGHNVDTNPYYTSSVGCC